MALGVLAGYRRVKVFFLIYSLLALALQMFSLATSVKPLSEKLLTTLSFIPYIWATVIVARDLLRRPVAGATGSAAGQHL
ncbi:hypothetical protein [Hymenobacter fodinae]|uniref:Uncharacterized protein n=1 Tax=Hymenobacter fodinae TaxID=2510796 RepID=A0A4Z0P2G0_9BACT|nr:hypothetical protein [Hymenobacter fodinae]TGE04937.1 hypothetical protein EU556_22465 [Hymenobacter fodinae]